MKKKNIITVSIISIAITFCVFVIQKVSHKSNNNLALGFTEALAADPAGPPPNDSCRDAFKAVLDAEPPRDSYAEPILDHLHDQLYRFNNIETADVEMIFCRLTRIMGVDPNLASLPQTITKTDPMGNTITVTITAPTEAFATTDGYTAKAVIASNGTTFLTMWWNGSGTSSKGYLIQGANPMELDGMTRLRYIQWDRSTDNQVVKVFATQFATSYLTSTTGSANSKTGGDMAHYGRMTYNNSTKEVTAQAIEVGAGRYSPTTFKCVRTAFFGTLEGTISGYRPALGTPEPVTDSYTDGTGMDGRINVLDSKTTASGTPSPGSALATGYFDYSCNDIYTANATGKAFASGDVDFTKDPSTIFPH